MERNVLYLRKKSPILFFVSQNIASFKKNHPCQHSCSFNHQPSYLEKCSGGKVTRSYVGAHFRLLSKKFPSFLLRWNGRTVVLSLKDGADRISSRVGGQVARVRGILYASFFISGMIRICLKMSSLLDQKQIGGQSPTNMDMCD